MVKKIILGIAVITLAMAAGTAMAGDYHRLSTLFCADCHTMHYSVTHNFTDGGAPAGALAGGPHERLLKNEANELCLSCHDGQTFAPDVHGANTAGGVNASVREAGAITDGTADYADWKGHTLGFSGAIPGGGTMTNLECVTCHSPHGSVRPPTGTTITYTDLGADEAAAKANGQWRNLTARVDGVATALRLCYVKNGANNPAADVFETTDTGATHYDQSNVAFNEPNTTKSAYGDWCKACHTSFHGSAADANMNNGTEWLRHPTAEANVTSSRYTGKVNKVKTMHTDGATGDYTPSCFTCHKAHGNKNAFGLIYMSGTGTVTEEGDSDGHSQPDLCHQCHGMGTS